MPIFPGMKPSSSEAPASDAVLTPDQAAQAVADAAASLPPEVGGAPGPEPTRYGDWAHKGRVSDF